MSFELGLSSCGKVIDRQLMQQYAENGIKQMEISMTYEQYLNADYSFIKNVAADYGVQIWSLHLPFSPGELINPANPDKKVHESTVDIDKRLIEKASYLGAKMVVVHGCRGPVSAENRPAWIAQAQRTLSMLSDFASKGALQIAVENQPRNALIGSSSDLLEVLSADDRLGICFDVNHLMPERDDHQNFLKICGHKIVTLHISDYDFLNERHWLPGEGKIDWQMLVNGLREIGYQGPWLYELGFDIPKTIYRSRTLTCADFKRNAEEIFGNKKITVIGKPVDGLLHWTIA